jgi:hypothetical protein
VFIKKSHAAIAAANDNDDDSDNNMPISVKTNHEG